MIDDVAELGVERLLLSDPDLAATIIKRELGALLADPRMGEELVETLQVYVDAGGNRRGPLADFTSPTGPSPIASSGPNTCSATASMARSGGD